MITNRLLLQLVMAAHAPCASVDTTEVARFFTQFVASLPANERVLRGVFVLVCGDRIALASGFGKALNGQPVDPERTLFRAASNSKKENSTDDARSFTPATAEITPSSSCCPMSAWDCTSSTPAATSRQSCAKDSCRRSWTAISRRQAPCPRQWVLSHSAISPERFRGAAYSRSNYEKLKAMFYQAVVRDGGSGTLQIVPPGGGAPVALKRRAPDVFAADSGEAQPPAALVIVQSPRIRRMSEIGGVGRASSAHSHSSHRSSDWASRSSRSGLGRLPFHAGRTSSAYG